jgi:hypothetical protein
MSELSVGLGEKTMINLAYDPKTQTPEDLEKLDAQCRSELEQAGLVVCSFELFCHNNPEIPTSIMGTFPYWGFTRSWYYWVAKGQGIPADIAEEFHKTWGQQVRVNGSCACPSPLEDNKGFAVGLYHIDTQEGLNAFVELLKKVYKG